MLIKQEKLDSLKDELDGLVVAINVSNDPFEEAVQFLMAHFDAFPNDVRAMLISRINDRYHSDGSICPRYLADEKRELN